jgi:hypothetical protein
MDYSPSKPIIQGLNFEINGPLVAGWIAFVTYGTTCAKMTPKLKGVNIS